MTARFMALRALDARVKIALALAAVIAVLAVALLGVVPLGQGVPKSAGHLEPEAGTWRPWVLRSVAGLRLPPPPDAAASEGEIRSLRTLAAQRDATALDLINFWDVGGPAFRWNEIVTDEITNNKLSTPASARARALVNVAIYDALVAAWDSKYAHRRPRPSEFKPGLSTVLPNPQSPSYPAEYAVVAGAASGVLSYLFPAEARSFEEKADQAGRSRVLAGVQYPSDVSAGLELGRKVAALVVERAKADGSDAKFTGTIPPGPGYWSGANPQEPAAVNWKMWVVDSARRLDPGPPAAFGSAQLKAELEQVKNFPRTPNSVEAAFFWNNKGGQFWNDLTNQKLFENHLDVNPPRAARAYALVNVAAYDATIVIWNVKYTYWMARPIQLDPAITTLFPTPSHPSYPSTNAGSWGATAEILSYLFPHDAEFFRARADEAAPFPFWAGIHFRRDTEVGLALGRTVAGLVIEQANTDGADARR